MIGRLSAFIGTFAAAFAVISIGSVMLIFVSLAPAPRSETIAAWVQAVGSIAAILGAYHLAERSHDHARTLEISRLTDSECHRIRVISAMVSPARAHAAMMSHFIAQSRRDDVLGVPQRFVAELRRPLMNLPSLEVPEYMLVLSLGEIVATLQNMEDCMQRMDDEKLEDAQLKYEFLLANDFEGICDQLLQCTGQAIHRCSKALVMRSADSH
jgi:hypothetical protein